MRLEENPFYVLGVTPCATIEEITDAAEDKKFDDDENEHVYEEARSILVSPVKRLEAEIRYPLEYTYDDLFDGRSLSDVIDQMKQGNTYADFTFDYAVSNIVIDTEQLSFETEENMVYVIEHLDHAYRESFDDDEFEMALDSLNESRSVSDIAQCDTESFREAIKSLRNDIRIGINGMFKRFDEEKVIEIANNVAEYLINKSHDYGEVLELFVSEYSVFIGDTLNAKKNRVLELIEYAHDYTEVFQLSDIDEAARDFDYVAQPIQLLLRDRGQSALQNESIEVAEAIKELIMDYYKNGNRSVLVMHLLELELELFSELTEFYENLKKEKEELKAASEFQKVQDDYSECKNYLDNNIVRTPGNDVSNRSYLQKILPKLRTTVDDMETHLGDATESGYIQYIEADRIMLVMCKEFGDACTWGCLWSDALFFLKKASERAYSLEDQRIIDIINDELRSVNQSIANQNYIRQYTSTPNSSSGDSSLSGALIGAGIGAAVGGPVGAVVGGIIGRWIGKK